jgi:hypothetical protein
MEDVVLKVSGKMREIDIIENEKVDEDDLDELDDSEPEVARVEYQVWLLGYDKDNNITGWDYEIDWFEDMYEAKRCFDFFTREPLSVIKNKDESFNIPDEVKSVCLTLEEVFFDKDGEEIETNVEEEYTFEKESNENEE